jgi:hypothetical protein
VDTNSGTAVSLPACTTRNYETDTLAHVDDSYYFGAYCRNCKHGARLSLIKLRAALGDAYPLVKIRHRLYCQNCRSRLVVVTFLAPNQMVGNLVQLFSTEPRQ